MLKGKSKAIIAENARSMRNRGMSDADAVMVSLKHSKKEMEASRPSEAMQSDGPSYPYGTRIDLEHETLKKMGIHKLPKVGQKMKITAHAHVHSASQHASLDSNGKEQRRSVGLQLTKMKLE